MLNLIEFSGSFLSNGVEIPFQVVIQIPEQNKMSGDYSSAVHSPQLFSRPMKVYGVSRHQTISLAVALVKDALLSQLITEKDKAYDFEREDELMNIRPLFHPQDCSNRIPSGRYIVQHEDESRLLEISYENGILHGPYVSFWPNGQVSSEGQHKVGKPDGAWHYYNRNGTLHAIIQFKDGDEIESAHYIYDADGVLSDIRKKSEPERKGVGTEWH